MQTETVPAARPLSVTLEVTPDIQSRLAAGEGALAIAEAYVIDSAVMAEAASNECTTWARAIDDLKARRKRFLAPAEAIIEEAKALFNPAIDNLTAARKLLLDGKLLTWTRAERERAAAEARRVEEEQRRLRQEAEARAAQERARAEEQARHAAAEAERLRAQAAEAEAAGDTKTAAKLVGQAAKTDEVAAAHVENAEVKSGDLLASIPVAAPVAAVPKKIAGVQLKDNWIAVLNDRVTEEQAKVLIVKACAERPELLGLLEINMGAVNKLAKALKTAFAVPGFHSHNAQQVAGARK